MNTVFVVEQIPKRERQKQSLSWRVAERGIRVRPDGRSKMLKDYRMVAANLSLSSAYDVLRIERFKKQNPAHLHS